MYRTDRNPGQTTVLVAPDLGEYSVIESAKDGTSNTGSVPSVVLMPIDGEGPTIVAVHAVAPRMEEMQQWQTDLQWIADQCPQGDFILAGDFNATIDHMAGLGVEGGDIGYCRDVAARTGNGVTGTWPSSLPPLAGAPIDHVMASAELDSDRLRRPRRRRRQRPPRARRAAGARRLNSRALPADDRLEG